MGVSRNTVRRAITAQGPPRYERMPTRSIVDEVEPKIRELLHAWPNMPATVIAERIGWNRGMTVLKDRIRELRPAYLPPDPASRTTYAPGELAQCDLWFPDVDLPLGAGYDGRAKTPALVIVSVLVLALIVSGLWLGLGVRRSLFLLACGARRRCPSIRPAPEICTTSTERGQRYRSRVDWLTVFGLASLSFMMLMYALERRGPRYVLAFAVGCALSSTYGFASGAWPFGVIEAIWFVVALRKFGRVSSSAR